MKIWVRSQNKCKLREAECIYYYYEAVKHIIDCNGYPVGTYESKKRCLEIIDEIQYLLKNNGSEEDRVAQLISGIKNEFVVYEMPEE